MRIGLTLAAWSVLVGCATAPPPPTAAPVAEESLGLSINSWGKPLFDWTVSASGDAVYTYARPTIPAKFFDYDLVTKRFRVAAADLQRLRALLSPARRYLGGTIPCEPVMTDAAYGRILWGERSVSYNLGCASKETRPVHDGLGAAQDLMERLARDAPEAEVKPVREPAG